MTTEENLFYLLRYELKGEKLPDDFNLTEQEIIRLYRLSKRHDLAHLIGDALRRLELLPEGKATRAFKKPILTAVSRYEQQNTVFQKLRGILREEKIAYIPLKGLIIRNCYPEPWMRTSCDIDILIHENDLEKTTKTLTRNGFVLDAKRDYKHLSFYYGIVHLELHFQIYEKNKQIDKILNTVWDNVEEVSSYEFKEKPEFYVLHHIVHMVRHFLSGGCGIRPFIDLWIMKNQSLYNEEKLRSLLESCNLYKFYQSVCALIEVWINKKEHSKTTSDMEKYILDGGVYGSSTNANMVGAAKNKSKIKYLLKIAFLPYDSMCVVYPSLKKHKILLPFYYIHRLISKIFGKDRKKAKDRIQNTMAQSKRNISFMNSLLNDLGINDEKDVF